MTTNLVPFGSFKILECVTRIFESNTEYNSDDVKWLNTIFVRNMKLLYSNPFKYYSLLTLMNMRIFSGYFAHIYNYKITKFTKERNEEVVVKMFINPEFVEFSENTVLSKEEKAQLLKVFEMEVFTTNLFFKRITLNPNFYDKFDETFEDSYVEVYTKLFRNDVSTPRNEFQDFVLVTEHNPRTKTNHAYTFKLIDLLIQCYNQNFSHNLSDVTVQNLCNKFDIELKIIEYNMQVLATI